MDDINLIDVDNLVNKFITDNMSGITTLYKHYNKGDISTSLPAMIESSKEELRTGCVSFINKKYPIEEINPYLFYIVNSFLKKNAVPFSIKKTEYICPGCLFLGKQVTLKHQSVLICHNCSNSLKEETDDKKLLFYKTFALHNRTGYHCSDCDRFIPHPMGDSSTVTCPYFDCMFSGSLAFLKKMHHPTTYRKPDKLILDQSKTGLPSLKDSIPDSSPNQLDLIVSKQTQSKMVDKIKSIIESQELSVPYNSSDFTVKHKLSVYQAFSNLLRDFPEEMVDYLVYQSRSGGFQNKIFQEYISLVEQSLPWVYKKNGKIYRVESLLDENMDLFKGVSVFDGIVNDNGVIKNNTKEFYIGGRSAAVTKPFYIGKLLNIVRVDNNESVLKLVSSYTFNLIKVKNLLPGTKVTVTHLRVPPHYQMGGMVYINRIRKKIVDRIKITDAQD